MRRLSIIDLAGGDQPIANEDGRIQVVQNGEIYNYRELRTELERQRPHLLHPQRHRGPGPPLRGARPRASSRSCAGCSRSRSGTRGTAGWCWPATASGSSPSTTGSPIGSLSFGSELKALLRQPGFSREIDPEALEAFLAFNSIPAPLTIFSEARKLPAGHTAGGREGGGRDLSATRARRRSPPTRCAPRARRTLAEELRDRLRDSVRAHLVSDVPVGVLLSGGIDSAALTALAAEESGYRVSTFSIGFEESSFDELGRRAWSPSATAPTTTSWSCGPTRSSCCRSWSRPSTSRSRDSSALPTYLVSQLASDTVKVVLSGEGGDELFGGYYTYVADRLAPRVGTGRAAFCGRWSSGCRAPRRR